VITLKEFMELVDYRVTEGSDYCWECFGSNSYSLSYWNQDHNGHSLCIIFDTRTHEVYTVEACDYKHNRAYRLINPDYKTVYDNEAAGREVNAFEAWDDVNYVDLDVDDDFIQKALAIIAGEDYDTRVSVPVNFTDEELLTYMKQAHERDITFNQLVEEALRAAIDEYKLNLVHETGTDNPIDFPVPKKRKKKKK
jgi:glutaredoxin